jgi:hypothetical protein
LTRLGTECCFLRSVIEVHGIILQSVIPDDPRFADRSGIQKLFISRFSDVRLHIIVRIFNAPRNDNQD